MFAQDFFEFLRTGHANCRVRLAPTPSGYLHTGNALNFILNWLVARYHGGKVLLRIDDLDAARKRPEYVADIRDSLIWLGLDWDEGPGLGQMEFTEDFEQYWSQYRRMALYINMLECLRATGKLFACTKSRNELAPFPEGYPDEFMDQNLSLESSEVSWRIQTSGITGSLKHFIVRRRDGIPAYQVASVADDLFFRITHVIRGEDLRESTQAQQFLAEVLKENNFLKINFLHHPLIQDSAGRKLSKSAGDASLQSMQIAGMTPGHIYLQVAQWLGLPPARSAQELLQHIRQHLSTDFSDI